MKKTFFLFTILLFSVLSASVFAVITEHPPDVKYTLYNQGSENREYAYDGDWDTYSLYYGNSETTTLWGFNFTFTNPEMVWRNSYLRVN